MKFAYQIIVLLILISCARNETLNLRPQNFTDEPRAIFWLHVPGLDIEHFAILKLHNNEVHSKPSFENYSCVGQNWSYNLFNLRPTSYESFLAQILGSKNVQGSCDDYKEGPIWNYLSQSIDSDAIIIENGISEKSSLTQSLKCNEDFLKEATLLRMSESSEKNAGQFHYQESIALEKGKIYYDKTCQKGNCFSSILNNTRFAIKELKERNKRPVVIIRDGRYELAIKENNLSKAREILVELERLSSYLITESQTVKNSLVLFNSASPLKIDFPPQGNQWQNFEKTGRGVTVKNTSLSSFILAKGNHAQNFCGIFEENEIPLRILWAPERKLFNW